VLSQSAAYSLHYSSEVYKKEQHNEKDDDQQHIKLADAVPSSTTQINLGYQSFLLEDLSKEDSEERESPSFTFQVPLEKAFKILFRQIISPNAP